MKRLIPIILLTVVLTALAGCRRASDNGKIDGMWQIREIEYFADGSTVYPENRFISIQLELIQLRAPSAGLTGVLTYQKNDTKIGVDFRSNPSDATLALFGFGNTGGISSEKNRFCTLLIERVDSKHLVLRSPVAVITCRRY